MNAVIASVLACVALSMTGPVAAAALRDPMRPHTHAVHGRVVSDVAPMRLQAIMGTDAARLAIVDGRVVRVGDTIGDVKIIAIAADGVHFSRRRFKGVLRLPDVRAR